MTAGIPSYLVVVDVAGQFCEGQRTEFELWAFSRMRKAVLDGRRDLSY